MAFPLEILKSGIRTANKLTTGVQSVFTLEQYTGQGYAGGKTYAAPVALHGVVDFTSKPVIKLSGETVTAVVTITVVGDILPNGAAGRREPVDPRDRIILSNGFTGPIIDAPGSVLDPSTGRGLIHVIMLGAV